MVGEAFDILLQELGTAIDVPDLRPDSNNSCLIQMQNELMVQLEIEESGDWLIIGTDLGEVPPGAFRTEVFKKALQYNARPFPRYGTFAFSPQKDHLIYFKLLHLKDLTGEKVATTMAPFTTKATEWKEALAKNDLSALSKHAPTASAGGIFGLQP